MALRFVIADDSPRPREYLSRVLEWAGYEVVGEFDDGDKVLKNIGKLKPDIVVLDVQMKRVHGSTAAFEIREKYPDITVILCSSGAQFGISNPLIQKGCLFVSKPYNEGQFLNCLKRELERVGLSTG